MKSPLFPRLARLLALGLLPLLGLAAELGDALGTIHFEVSGTPDAQAHVVRGVKLVHHMMYPEADVEFAAAVQVDPGCTLAYWGRAMTLIHPLWPDAPTAAELEQGAAYLREGLRRPARSERERGYLEVLQSYFLRPDPGDHAGGLQLLDPAWANLAARYPQDLDALAFAALYHLAPARFLPKDKSRRVQLEAGASLLKVLAQIPDHPGALHYKIHAYDSPLLADRALEVCDTYSGIAPDVPHALHMPTHIFTRRGMWEKSIEFNLRSAEAARKLGESAGALNGHLPHALDYLVYAYLQRGQYKHAEAIRRAVLELKGPFSAVQPTAMSFAFAAIPARCALEQQAWREAAALALHAPAAFPWGPRYLNCDSIVHFARGLGAARSGQPDLAQAEIAELERLQREFAKTNRVSYWASQAETQQLTIRAWLAFETHQTDKALTLMRRAVALEASADKEPVTPGEVLPAGDSLGEMLLAAKRHREALNAFEAVLAASPNRLNSLYGAGLAAERAGDEAKARSYYQQVATVAAAHDRATPRLEHARAYLANVSAPSATR